MNAPTRGKVISGQKLAVFLVGALALTTLLVIFCLATYGKLTAIRNARDECWRPLAELLDARYRKLEKVIAGGIDQRQIDMRWGEKWRSALDHFRAISGSSEQELAAQEVEDLLRDFQTAITDAKLQQEIAQTMSAVDTRQQISVASTEYRQLVNKERVLLRSIGGRLLDTFLVLRPPLEFHFSGLPEDVGS